LRATLKDFDHGPFIDEACFLLEGARKKVKSIEDQALSKARDLWRNKVPRDERELELSRFLGAGYEAMANKEPHLFDELDAFLREHLRPGTCVHWSGDGQAPHGMLFRTQPLHRILAWRLVTAVRGQDASYHRPEYREENIEVVLPLDQEGMTGSRFQVRAIERGAGQSARPSSRFYHDVIVRTGPRKNFEDFLPEIFAKLEARSKGRKELPAGNQDLLQPAFDLFWTKGQKKPERKEQEKPAEDSSGECQIKVKSIVVIDRLTIAEIRDSLEVTKGHGNILGEAMKEAGYALEKIEDPESNGVVLLCLKLLLHLDSGLGPRPNRIEYILNPKRPDPLFGPIARAALPRKSAKAAYPCTIFTYDDYQIWARFQHRIVASATLSKIVRTVEKLAPADHEAYTLSLLLGKCLFDKLDEIKNSDKPDGAWEAWRNLTKLMTRSAHRPAESDR
jgi:hypothetical protein